MPFLPFLSGLWSFATSQVGVAIIIAIFSFGYGSHRANVACAQKEATAEADRLRARIAEDARQRAVSAEIQAVDSARVKDDDSAAAAMQVEIDSLKAELKAKPHEKDCALDPATARRLQRLDRASRSKR